MNPALYYLRRGDVARRHVRFVAWWYFLSEKGRANYRRALAAMVLESFRFNSHPAAGLGARGVG